MSVISASNTGSVESKSAPSRRKVLIASALFLVGFMTAAASQAAVPTLHETQTVEVAASPDKIWSIAGNFVDLTWVPAVKASSATNGNKPGSVRALDFGGPKLMEELVKYDAKKHTYTYKIINSEDNRKIVPVSNVVSSITVAPAGNGSKVTWEASFTRVDPTATPAEGKDDATAQKTISGVFGLGLGALKKSAEAN